MSDSPLEDVIPEESPEWRRIEQVQHQLAKALRQHETGKQIDVTKLTASLVELITRPVAKPAGQEEPVTISGTRLVDEYWPHIATRKEAMSTGLKDLDEMLGGGLEPGRLVILLGAPGGGKTTLANQIAVHIADAGRPIVYVTSEDMPHALLAKTIARKGQINYKAVLKGYKDSKTEIDNALREYRESEAAERLHYVDATMMLMDMDTIKQAAHAHFERYKDAGQGILVLDYLQRLARSQASYRSGNADLRQAVTILTEQLRGIATELDCCVLALASMSRASGYASANNTLAAGKESGDIEYTADVMMAIGEDKDRVPGVSWLQARVLKIDKNRQGETGQINLDWYGSRQQFTGAEGNPAATTMPASNGNGKKRGGK